MASAWREAEPAATPATTSARNMDALIARAIQSTRRQCGLLSALGEEQWSSWQQPAMGHLVKPDLASHMHPVVTTGSRAWRG